MNSRKSSIATEQDFTLNSVVTMLFGAGTLKEDQARAILTRHAGAKTAVRQALAAAGHKNDYVSPLEIIAAFGFPSRNPRQDRMDEVEVCRAFSAAAGVPFSRIDPLKLDAKTLCSIISKPFARTHLLVPIRLESNRLTVAMVNPFDRRAIDELESVTSYVIRPVLGLRMEILRTINEIFAFEHSLQKAEKQRPDKPNLGNLEQLVSMMGGEDLDASDQHIVKAVDLLLSYAFEQRASDIHIEPKRNHAVVRLRIDGSLHDTHSIPIRVFPSFLSRIKIISRMDIAEKRKPQDGRIKTTFKDTEIELRVSTVPVAFGEKVVIRIFDPAMLVQNLSTLGFFKEQQAVFERIIQNPYGIVLVTGPTGSGKTTTLYSSLQYLAKPEVNIVTVEDPIEMVHEPFNQIAVQEQAGVTFPSALRSILRQDPDIIMVGEIRDEVTAQYAVQAALTGHLVFSTLHTNSAVGAVTRLADLGMEPFLIASTVIGIVSQRLVRLVCPHCNEPASISDDERYLLGIGDTDVDLSKIQRGTGCQKCRKTGYLGRTAIHEIVEVTDRIRAMIRDQEDERAIAKTARRAGMEPLMTGAVRKLLLGQTTVEEILRVIPLGG